MKQELHLTVILEPQPEGGFTVSVPALPEIATEGETEEEALSMATDAIRFVLDYRKEHKLPMPDDILPTMRTIKIAA